MRRTTVLAEWPLLLFDFDDNTFAFIPLNTT